MDLIKSRNLLSERDGARGRMRESCNSFREVVISHFNSQWYDSAGPAIIHSLMATSAFRPTHFRLPFTESDSIRLDSIVESLYKCLKPFCGCTAEAKYTLTYTSTFAFEFDCAIHRLKA